MTGRDTSPERDDHVQHEPLREESSAEAFGESGSMADGFDPRGENGDSRTASMDGCLASDPEVQAETPIQKLCEGVEQSARESVEAWAVAGLKAATAILPHVEIFAEALALYDQLKLGWAWAEALLKDGGARVSLPLYQGPGFQVRLNASLWTEALATENPLTCTVVPGHDPAEINPLSRPTDNPRVTGGSLSPLDRPDLSEDDDLFVQVVLQALAYPRVVVRRGKSVVALLLVVSELPPMSEDQLAGMLWAVGEFVAAQTEDPGD